MSTGKTANLQLNQWTLANDFLMEEFNADNRKIDAALMAEAAARTALPYVKLMDTTTYSAAQSVSLNLSSIDMTKLAHLEIMAIMPATITDANSSSYYIDTISAYFSDQNGTTLSRYSQGGTASAASFTVTAAKDSWACGMRLRLTLPGQAVTGNYSVFAPLTVALTGHLNSSNIYTQPFNGGLVMNAGIRPAALTFWIGRTASKISAGARFVVYGVKL